MTRELLDDLVMYKNHKDKGSVFGPILFLIFINDVTESFDVNCFKSKLFADDLKSCKVVD